jgi:hypothetical protein
VPTIQNSTFLDLTSHRLTDAKTVVEAYDLDPASVRPANAEDGPLAVALVLDRAQDPTELLAKSWGERQTAIAELEAEDKLWSTYGTDPAVFNEVVQSLEAEGITVLGPDDGYVSSAESRTVWVNVTADQFEAMFGTQLLISEEAGLAFWEGALGMPSLLEGKLAALWPDLPVGPAVAPLSDREVTLPQGEQSIGNGANDDFSHEATPVQIAALYDFPSVAEAVETGTIGLIENVIGDALPDDATESFQERLDAYRADIGIDTPGTYYVDNRENQEYNELYGGERSLDVGVLAGAAPNSTIGLYVGSGDDGTVFTSYQTAIWDQEFDPKIISSSFSDPTAPSPDSPFLAAYRELFVDAALRNQSIFSAVGDGGSSNEVANGLTNVDAATSSPYGISVGGTSISMPDVAAADATLTAIVAKAEALDPAVLQVLVAGGLDSLPGNAPESSISIETVWNQYTLNANVLNGSYLSNQTTSGGVDTTQPTPWYQTAFGLEPTTADPLAETGRGVPDVAALAGGNLFYIVPTSAMELDGVSGGTSAATPLWAALTAQINAVFADQGLPAVGYMNDLLYIAAAVAPGSFNDIALGNNVSSFIHGGEVEAMQDDGSTAPITPTGFGYEAGKGYDLTTGLGSPNGELLTRTLTTIAQSQLHSDDPGLVSDKGSSAATQSLLLQPMLKGDVEIQIDRSGNSLTWVGEGGSAYGWTDQFAQQALQADFDPELVRLFDDYAQSRPYQLTVGKGEELSVEIGDDATGTFRADLTEEFGFLDYVTQDLDQALHVSQAVAVAETADGADDQDAIVRMRQNGEKDLRILFYEVDDLTGTVDGIRPGDEAYADAALTTAYRSEAGDSWIEGPGYGEYLETSILDVDSGDLVAMWLSSGANDFFAFAEANEKVDGQPVTHLWNYGLNSWGWEDLKGGGDFDFNDLVVQLDFVNASGSGLVA